MREMVVGDPDLGDSRRDIHRERLTCDLWSRFVERADLSGGSPPAAVESIGRARVSDLQVHRQSINQRLRAIDAIDPGTYRAVERRKAAP